MGPTLAHSPSLRGPPELPESLGGQSLPHLPLPRQAPPSLPQAQHPQGPLGFPQRRGPAQSAPLTQANPPQGTGQPQTHGIRETPRRPLVGGDLLQGAPSLGAPQIPWGPTHQRTGLALVCTFLRGSLGGRGRRQSPPLVRGEGVETPGESLVSVRPGLYSSLRPPEPPRRLSEAEARPGVHPSLEGPRDLPRPLDGRGRKQSPPLALEGSPKPAGDTQRPGPNQACDPRRGPRSPLGTPRWAGPAPVSPSCRGVPEAPRGP